MPRNTDETEFGYLDFMLVAIASFAILFTLFVVIPTILRNRDRG